jgi:hypothetical protein
MFALVIWESVNWLGRRWYYFQVDESNGGGSCLYTLDCRKEEALVSACEPRLRYPLTELSGSPLYVSVVFWPLGVYIKDVVRGQRNRPLSH